MKKLFAVLLALLLALSMVSALAEETPTYEDVSSVTVTKVYKLVGSGSSPAETFTLRQVGSKVLEGDAESAPALGTITGAEFAAGAATAEGAKASITINLPTYDRVGVYEYTLQEVAGNNAGVTYYGETIKLVVTVINGTDNKIRIAAVHTESAGEKSDSFTNTYSAGSLSVSKTVTGNLGDKNKYFEFKVTLTGEEDKTYAESFAVTGGSSEQNPETIALGGEGTTFYLKDGETITIANLPYGVEYAVTETPVKGYTTTKTGDTGTINAATQTAAFENNNDNGSIDTGITTDSMPYIVLMGIVVLAGVAMIAKRRAANND